MDMLNINYIQYITSELISVHTDIANQYKVGDKVCVEGNKGIVIKIEGNKVQVVLG